MDGPKYLVVEGPIGVGKSSLASLLADDMKARLVLEEVEKNPFLASFYQDPEGLAFQTQLFFLLSRYRQQSALKQQNLFNQTTVCDYLFAKDQIFAQINLSEEEIDLYNQIYQLLDARLPKPDLVIYLQATVDVLMERIKKRKVLYEVGITEEYLEQLSQAYSTFFFRYSDSPILFVNASGLDFVENKKDFDTLKKELYSMVANGKDRHYVTIDSR